MTGAGYIDMMWTVLLSIWCDLYWINLYTGNNCPYYEYHANENLLYNFRIDNSTHVCCWKIRSFYFPYTGAKTHPNNRLHGKIERNNETFDILLTKIWSTYMSKIHWHRNVQKIKTIQEIQSRQLLILYRSLCQYTNIKREREREREA